MELTQKDIENQKAAMRELVADFMYHADHRIRQFKDELGDYAVVMVETPESYEIHLKKKSRIVRRKDYVWYMEIPEEIIKDTSYRKIKLAMAVYEKCFMFFWGKKRNNGQAIEKLSERLTRASHSTERFKRVHKKDNENTVK